jgi:DNA-directed RNA polymerase specialized sigma24 family protein
MPGSTADLVERCKGGQGSAFDALFDRYKDYVYRVTFFGTCNSGDTEEVIQETFIDVCAPRSGVSQPMIATIRQCET